MVLSEITNDILIINFRGTSIMLDQASKQLWIFLAGIIAIISAIMALSRLNSILKGILLISDTINAINQTIDNFSSFISRIIQQIPFISSIPPYVWDWIFAVLAIIVFYYAFMWFIENIK